MRTSIRASLSRLLLRGAVRERWIARRGRQLDRAYCVELVKTLTAPSAPAVAPSFTSPGALRKILFIADCMWERNDLVPELRKIAEVAVLDLQPILKRNSQARPNHEVVAEAIRTFIAEHSSLTLDVVFFYARPTLLSDEVFEHLRRRWRCPLFGMSLDDKLQFFPHGVLSDGEDNYQYWAKKFDLNLTNCLAATEWYRQRGLPCVYVPQGVHRSDDLAMPASSDFKYEFSFLGSIKPERKVIINQLRSCGVPIQLFGSGWPNTQWVDSPNSVYRGTQINLGIGFASPSLTLTTIKGRDFECPGVGACYLTTYNWELACHWELGREILCYRSVEELIEMYAYYRKRREECLKIAQAAWRRATNEHTWEKRFRKVFKEAGFRI